MDRKTILICAPLAFIGGCLFALKALVCANHHLQKLPVKIKTNKENQGTSLENLGAVAEPTEEKW